MTTLEEKARICYKAYRDSYQSTTDDVLPSFSDLGHEEGLAWREVASTICAVMRDELKP